MNIRFSALIVSALAISAFAGPSFADTTWKPGRHHHVAAPAARRSDWRELSEDFFTGPVQNSDSHDRYFTDTREPPTRTLGAPFLSEWPD